LSKRSMNRNYLVDCCVGDSAACSLGSLECVEKQN
jgi:hypothetical protein